MGVTPHVAANLRAIRTASHTRYCRYTSVSKNHSQIGPEWSEAGYS
ncbi:hypothetical protein EDF39_0659 [Frondihabitans sp. PhB161]|nr:hypothetical protein EDF37_0658 [Frondihabitans sp. PhB153]RPF08269.1 hypothetical protein EDF39_0659 [Frondihabitans sp. PhB161]